MRRDGQRRGWSELGYEVLVFHATGAGGRALEALAAGGLLAGVLDMTTTELADDLVGGVLSAGPDRLTAAGAAGLPQVIAPGALDMVNFGPRDTVPERFAGRKLYVHNPTVTLMRTTAEENGRAGRQDRPQGQRRRPGRPRCSGRTGGVSALDADGQPFFDAGGRRRLFDALAADCARPAEILHRIDAHINDPAFAWRWPTGCIR